MTSPPARLRRIAHLDMDAFYASIELLRYPQLAGIPVVIGGGRRRGDGFDERLLAQAASRHPERSWTEQDLAHVPVDCFPTLATYSGRGVITTATYPARQFGVGSAMGLMKAAQLCPQAVLLPVDFEAVYRQSRAFKAIITRTAPVMENRGIDEVYIDFTEVPGGQDEGGRVLAARLQAEILAATGLTCSIGIAPNKLLAKMASEFHKPKGIAVLYEHELRDRIWPLSVRKINGIGPKTEAKLLAHDIHTIGQLAQLAEQATAWLQTTFGPSYGHWLAQAAWGLDDSPVITHSEPVSISRETTFERNLHAVRDKAELGAVFTQLCEQVAADLQAKAYAGRTIGIKLRDDRFKTITRDHTVETPIADARSLRRAAGLALKRAPLQRPLRLLGVRVGKLYKVEVDGAMGPVPTSVHSHAVASPTEKSTRLKQKLHPAQDHQAQLALLFED
ncbi:MAG: hypothetical protein RLZZ612_1873 [Pseudomonadota bacterium]